MNTNAPSTTETTRPIAEPFDGYPYLVTRVAPSVHHIILLPADESYDTDRLLSLARTQATVNKLPTCIVAGPHSCLFIDPDGSEAISEIPPRDAMIETGKLLPSESIPNSRELTARKLQLRLHVLRQLSDDGSTAVIPGDITKGGRPPYGDEVAELAGLQENGVPKGLVRCGDCREWRGECFDTLWKHLVVRVHCRCENDSLCAACLRPLAERKVAANYYSEEDGKIWHVPGFSAFEHTCVSAVNDAGALVKSSHRGRGRRR